MNKDKTKDTFSIFSKIYIGYIVFLVLASLYAKLNGLIYRRYLVFIFRCLILISTLVLLYLFKKKIPQEKQKMRFMTSVLMIVITFLSAFFLSVDAMSEDKEYVFTEDEITSLKVEKHFFASLEISCHDRFNAICYKEYPCVKEVYDDGDIGQLVYIDHYDENGELMKRVFTNEK